MDKYKTADLFWVINAAGQYVAAYAHGDYLGYSISEILGKQFHDFFLPPDKYEFQIHFNAVRRTAMKFENLPSLRLAKNGAAIPVISSGAPIVENDGCCTGFCGVSFITPPGANNKYYCQNQYRHV